MYLLVSGNTTHTHTHTHTHTYTYTHAWALSHFRQNVPSLERNGTSISGLELRHRVTRQVLLPTRLWNWTTLLEELQCNTGRCRTTRASYSPPTSQKEFSKWMWDHVKNRNVLHNFGTKQSWCNTGHLKVALTYKCLVV